MTPVISQHLSKFSIFTSLCFTYNVFDIFFRKRRGDKVTTKNRCGEATKMGGENNFQRRRTSLG